MLAPNPETGQPEVVWVTKFEPAEQFPAAKKFLQPPRPRTAPPLAVRLLEVLRAAPEGLNRRDLHAALGGHASSSRVREALSWLQEEGRAHPRRVATGGRPSEQWVAGPDTCEQSEQSEQRGGRPEPAGPAPITDPAGSEEQQP